MQETIGKVILDETWYSGEDLYTDGEVEDQLLAIARASKEEDPAAAVAREKNWPVLYHFSGIRENIVDTLPLTKKDSVLEIGAGCGAVTGALAAKAGSVTCVDLSRKRSMVNAYRHRDCGNVRILVGNYADIEPHLTEKYDYITLIGVFEYAAAYIGGEDPYREFLRQARSHLKEDGCLVIAIENRLGLKYWAGCREDHTGHLFEGLENYPDEGAHARTFSRPALEKLCRECGFEGQTFYYPYPDYKLPLVLHSDDYLPGEGDLRTNNWNFDRERLVFFNEGAVWDSLIADGTYPLFANSFLLCLTEKKTNGAKERVLYSKFSGERAAQFALRTDICANAAGERFVRKTACRPEGDAHIVKMKEAGPRLAALFAGTALDVNAVLEKDNGRASVCFEWLSGRRTLEQQLGGLWKRGEAEKALDILRAFSGLLREKATEPFTVTPEFTDWFGERIWVYEDRSLPLTDLDMVTENIMTAEPAPLPGEEGIRAQAGEERMPHARGPLKGEGSTPGQAEEERTPGQAKTGAPKWTLIDYEWVYEFPVPVDYVIFRIWHYFFARSLPETDPEVYLEAEGFTREKRELYAKMERHWQEKVLGDAVPVRSLYAAISPGLRDPLSEMDLPDRPAGPGGKSTLSWGDDLTDPEREYQERELSLDVEGHFCVRFSLEESRNARVLRWDPIEGSACRVTIEKITGQGMVLPVPVNGYREDGADVFWTADPVYELRRSSRDLKDLTIEGRIERMHLRERLPEIDHLTAERNAFRDETERLRAEVAAMQGTKAFRAVEKLRQLRNFIMARVRAFGPFRDPHAVQGPYQEWLARHSASAQELEQQRRMCLTRQPMFSILVPVYQTPENFLREMIASVQAQTWPHWELCIADGTPGESLPEKIIQEIAAGDPRIRYVRLEQNGGISENTNRAADLAQGDYITLLDHDDLLAPDALFEAAQAVCTSDPDVMYTDEDKVEMDGKRHFDPNLKPDFSLDLLRSHNYITHLFVVRRSLFEQVGRFRREYDGAQDYDLIFRCCEKAEKIVHIPKILYYWRCHSSSTAENPESKLYAYEAGRRAIEDHLQRCGVEGKVERLPWWGLNHVTYAVPEDAFVSIIIPNKDHTDDLERCVRSVMELSSLRSFEIIVVENNSGKEETFRYYEELTARYEQVKVVRYQGAFNYPAVNNFGVRHAKGNYLLFLNNDTKMIAPESLSEMVGICSRPEVGCAGAKLLFENDTIQHAGIVLGFGGFAGHVFSGEPKDTYGFMMRPLITCNYSAVTAACMMLRRDVYEQVGGLDERFAVALNDVDLCMKIRRAGYLIVYTPFSCWYHYESLSRGYEDTPEKKARFEREVALFRRDWADVVDAPDPFYNPNFSLEQAPFKLW